MSKKSIEPKKQNRLNYLDVYKDLESITKQKKLKDRVIMKKQGRITDIDYLTMSVFSGRVK